MRESVASRTAFRVALRRAEHQVLDHPRLFEDPLSLRIIGPEAAAEIQPGALNRQQRLTPSFRAFMAVRSRYAEDRLAEAVAHGMKQYVVLGAGLDTFAYRNPHPSLHVYEVDHPATQTWKRQRLSESSIEIPASANFAAADFERQTLTEALAATSFRFDLPAFFSWLGVTPYLTDTAFDQTLRFIAARPGGSAVVFDYSVPRELLNAKQQQAFDALAFRVTNFGEPFHLFLHPSELTDCLRLMGFTHIEDLGREELNARYFAHRDDGLRVRGNLARLLHASL